MARAAPPPEIGVIQAVPVPLLLLDTDLRAVAANHAFYRTFDVPPDAINNRPGVDSLLAGRVSKELLAALWQVVVTRTPLEHFRVRAAHEGRNCSLLADARFLDSRDDLLLLSLRELSPAEQQKARLSCLGKCFLSLSINPEENIARLARLCGEVLNASCVLYNRLYSGVVCSAGTCCEQGENALLSELGESLARVIARQPGDDILILRDLPNSPLVGQSSALRQFGFHTCLGKPVRCGAQKVGSLCVLYEGDFSPGEDERHILNILAGAIAVEEERRLAEKALQQARSELEKRVRERTARLTRANELLKQEIAERKQLEEALRRSEERYTLASSAGKVIVWDWDVRTGSVYVAFGLRELLGYEDESAADLDPAFWRSVVHPADREYTRAALHAHLEGKTPHFEVTHRLVHRNGQIRWFLARGTALRDEEGKPYRIVGTTVDITERKQIEEALRQLEERFAKAFHASPAAIAITRKRDGYFIDVNESFLKLTGYAASEVVGHTSLELNIWVDHGDRKRILGQIEQKGALHSVEIPYRTKSGEVRLGLASFEPIRLGREECLLTLFYDVTERKRAQQHALELAIERERVAILQQFIDDVSHDLKTPITTLRVTSTVISTLSRRLLGQIEELESQAESLDVEDARELAAMIDQRVHSLEEGARRLGRLVESMLEMLRLDKREAFEFIPCNFNDLIEGLVNMYRPIMAQKGLTLRFEAGESLPSVRLDGDAFSRVVENLLSNAAHYTPEGGTVTVRTYARDGRIVLEVQDTGIGIPEEDLPHIFDRFYRADKARAAHTGGSGLGLAIARKIVEAHRGEFSVESKVDRGSLFRVTLPTEPPSPRK